MNEQFDLFASAREPAPVVAQIITFPLARRTKMIRTVSSTLAKRVTDEGKMSFWNRTVNGLRQELQRRGCGPDYIEAEIARFREAIGLELARQQHDRQQA